VYDLRLGEDGTGQVVGRLTAALFMEYIDRVQRGDAVPANIEQFHKEFVDCMAVHVEADLGQFEKYLQSRGLNPPSWPHEEAKLPIWRSKSVLLHEAQFDSNSLEINRRLIDPSNFIADWSDAVTVYRAGALPQPLIPPGEAREAFEVRFDAELTARDGVRFDGKLGYWFVWDDQRQRWHLEMITIYGGAKLGIVPPPL
jgi:hypothetical protein